MIYKVTQPSEARRPKFVGEFLYIYHYQPSFPFWGATDVDVVELRPICDLVSS